MVVFVREDRDGQYACRMATEPLAMAANAEKKVPREWINEAGNGVTQAFIDYAAPLIRGENHRATENGMPRFAKLKKVRAKAE